MEESAKMAETAIVYKNVADGLDSVEESTESIISTMRAFGIASNDTMSIIDKFNEVGNNFAITSAGIGEALQRSASALYEAGNSIDESIALVTAGNSVIQNPEQVGTALKTLALRLRGTKTELENAGLETDNMAESTSQLQAKLKALTHGKVDIMIDANNFKNTTQILREMANAWQDMTDVERSAALELMGGKRQANILASLISNFDTVEQVIATSQNSAGSALAENEKYLNSIQGKLDQLSNSTQTMWMHFMNSDVVKFLITVATALVKITDQVGLLNVAVAGFIAKTAAKSEKFGIGNWLSNKQSADAIKAAASAGTQVAQTAQNIGSASQTAAAGVTILGHTLKAGSLAFKLFNAAATAGLSLLIGFGVNLAYKAIDAWIHRVENLKQEVKELTDEYENANKTFNKNIATLTTSGDTNTYATLLDEFKALAAGVDQYGNNIGLTSSQYERYKAICDQIVGVNPKIAAGYDSNTKAIGNNVNILSQLIELQKIAARQNAEEYLKDENLETIASEKYEDFKEAKSASDNVDLISEQKNRDTAQFLVDKFANPDGKYREAYGNSVEEVITNMLDMMGYDEDNIKTILEKYADGHGGYNSLDFFTDFMPEISQKEYAFNLDDGTNLIHDFLEEVEYNYQDISKYAETVQDSKDGLINTLLQVPISSKDYEQLNDGAQKFITEWIKNDEQFKIPDGASEKDVQDLAKSSRDNIKAMISELADSTNQVEINGKQLTAQDLIDQVYNLDPSTVSWEKYKNQIGALVDGLYELIGGDANEFGIERADFEIAFGLNFEETDGLVEDAAKQIAEFLKTNIPDIENKLKGLTAEEVKIFASIDWSAMGTDGITSWQDVLDQIRSKMPDSTPTVKTYSQISDVVSKYNDVVAQSAEIVSDNTQVTQEYKDALIEAGFTTEELVKCFGEENGLIVKNAQALKELTEAKKDEIATTIRLTRAHAELQYNDVVRSISDQIVSTTVLDNATMKLVDSLFEQANALRATINQYQLLESSLLGATNAFTQFSKAKEIDSQNTYGSTLVEMAQTMYDAIYKTGEVGSEAFWAAVKATVPDDIYMGLAPGEQQIQAISRYLQDNLFSGLTFSGDSFSIDYSSIESFVKKAQSKGLFSGSDVTAFDLSPTFKASLKEGEDGLKKFAEQLGVTEEYIYAIFSEMDKYNSNGMGLSMLFQLDNSTTSQLTILNNQLEQALATRKRLLQQGADLSANTAEISRIQSQQAGVKTLARANTTKYLTATNALKDPTQKVKDVLSQDLILEMKLNGEQTVESAFQRISDWLLQLEEPTVLDLEISQESIEAEIQNLETTFGKENLETELKIRNGVIDGTRNDAISDATLDQYSDLLNLDQYIDDALSANLTTTESLLTQIAKNTGIMAGTEEAPAKEEKPKETTNTNTNTVDNTNANNDNPPESTPPKTSTISAKGMDVDLNNRKLVKFNLENFQSWADYLQEIVDNVDGVFSDEVVANAKAELEDIQRGDSTATVYSQTYYKSDFAGFNVGEDTDAAVVVTPILPDGTVLTPGQLAAYAEQILNGQEIDANITLGIFDGENFEEEAAQFANDLHESQAELYGLNDIAEETKEKLDNLLNIKAPDSEVIKLLQTLSDEDKTKAITGEEAQLLGFNFDEGQIITYGEALDRLIARHQTFTSGLYKVKQAGIETYSALQSQISSYNDLFSQTEEVISNGTKVTEEYKNSLIALGVDKTELNDCFDVSTGLIVKDTDALKKLVDTAKKNTANNVKLAKSQAQLKYYELYKEMRKVIDGNKKLNSKQLAHVNTLYKEMGAVQSTIAKYSLLEAQLLGVSNAYDRIEGAQQVDSIMDYRDDAENLVNILGNAFNTGELGTEAARVAFEGLIPDSVIDKSKTLDEQMAQAYKYFTKGTISKLFEIEFDKDGNISSVEMTLKKVKSYMQTLTKEGKVFTGTWDKFELNPEIKSMEDFAKALNMTEEMAFAFLTNLEKYDISWLGGDMETLLDQLMGDNLEYQIQKTTEKTAKLLQEKASLLGKDNLTKDEQKRLAEINKELDTLGTKMDENQDKAYAMWQAYDGANNAEAALSKLSQTAALTKDQFNQIFAGVDSETMQKFGITWNEDTSVADYLQKVRDMQLALGQPSEVILEFAKAQAEDQIKEILGVGSLDDTVTIKAQFQFDEATGTYTYTGDKDLTAENRQILEGAYGEWTQLGDLLDVPTVEDNVQNINDNAQEIADNTAAIKNAVTGEDNTTEDNSGGENPPPSGGTNNPPTSAQSESDSGNGLLGVLVAGGAAIGAAVLGALANGATDAATGIANGVTGLITDAVDTATDLLTDGVSNALDGDNNKVEVDVPDDGVQVDVSDDGLPVDVPDDGLPLDIPENGVPLDIPDNGIPLDVPEEGLPLDTPDDGIALNIPDDGLPLDMPESGLGLNIPEGGVPLNIPENGIPLDIPDDGLEVQVNNDQNRGNNPRTNNDTDANSDFGERVQTSVQNTTDGILDASAGIVESASQIVSDVAGAAEDTVDWIADKVRSILNPAPAREGGGGSVRGGGTGRDGIRDAGSGGESGTSSESVSITVQVNDEQLTALKTNLEETNQFEFKPKNVSISTSGVDTAKRQITGFKTWLDGLNLSKTIKFNISLPSIFGNKNNGNNNGGDGGNGNNGGSEGPGEVNGTAHVAGTAFATGSWGAQKTETALVGELGPELLVRNGRYTTIGENGAEFTDIRKGDIIFNHKQTESLLSKGYITGRGKAYAEGTAYAGINTWTDKAGQLSKDYGSGSGSGSGSEDDFKEIFDWIAVRIEEITEVIELTSARLENAVGVKNKNSLIDEAIKANQKLYDNLTAGAATYYKYAEQLLAKIPAEYRAAAQDGTIAIEEFAGKVGEETYNAISDYREWVQKGADATRQAEETLTEISALAKQAIDNISAEFENRTSLGNNAISQLEAYNALIETTQGFEAAGIYQAMIKENNKNIQILKQQRNQMQAELNKRVEAGEIKKYSQDWYDAVNSIAEVDTEIINLTKDTNEYQDSVNELHWEQFDALIDRLDAISNESNNLIDILGNKDLVDEDTAEWTDEGITSLGLYAQQLEVAEMQAKKYRDEIAYLNKNWKALGYTEQEYAEKLEELKSGQYDAIKAYHDTKKSIVDLTSARVDAIKDGIQKEIDAYEELINKKKEELDSEKDLYDFQKNVKQQQKDIAEIQRKLAALSSDNSASARAQRAKLQAELAEAQANLEDTYYDRSVSDQQDALDKELENFQDTKDKEIEALEEYLEDTEQVVADALATIQSNTDVVYNTLSEMGKEYSLSIADSIVSPWQDGESAIQSYSEKFGLSMSSTVEQLKELEAAFKQTIAEIEKSSVEAVNTVQSNIASYQAAVNQTPARPSQPAGDVIVSGGGSSSSGGSYPYGRASDTSGNIKRGAKGDDVRAIQYALNQLGYGNSGTTSLDGNFGSGTESAVKSFQRAMGIKVDGIVGTNTRAKFRANGYASGTTGTKQNELAWIDEMGLEELVMHAGPNGRLQYLSKGTSVVPADITSNLMEWGALDPQNMLDQNRPVISSPRITNNNIQLTLDVGEVVHIDTVTNDTIPDLTKTINKELDKYMKGLNSQIRKYVR